MTTATADEGSHEHVQGDRSESGPLIVLDECHKAKNLLSDTGTPTLVGFAVTHMQKLLPEACVLYSSATGISEPRNMAYMTRLGTCGCTSMATLINRLIKAGLGASELFSCSLKASGAYLGRCAAALQPPAVPGGPARIWLLQGPMFPRCMYRNAARASSLCRLTGQAGARISFATD